jgi:peptidoglycan/LPS O-acetylase OafA/YrhL
LLFKGDPATVTLAIAAAFAGVALIGAALQGYVLGLGQVPANARGQMARVFMIAGGVLLAAPSPRLTGLSFSLNLTAGAVLAALGLFVVSLAVRKSEKGRLSP